MSETKKEGKGLRAFLESYKGKTLFNYFYGFGAAVAILGTLFKILHLDGANVMLAVGLGTEVLMFAISAFEPPFRQYRWDEVFPVLKSGNPEDRPSFEGGQTTGGPVIVGGAPLSAAPMANAEAPVQNAGMPIVAGGPVMGAAQVAQAQSENVQPAGVQPAGVQPANVQPAGAGVSAEDIAAMQAAATTAAQATMAAQSAAQAAAQAEELGRIPQISFTEEETQTLEKSLKEYIEQMDAMNLNLRGLNTIYEIQLKSISSQIDTIDRINQGLLNIKGMYEGSTQDSERFHTETEAMANNLSSLNQIYGRMLQAMMSNNSLPGMPQADSKNDSKDA